MKLKTAKRSEFYYSVTVLRFFAIITVALSMVVMTGCGGETPADTSKQQETSIQEQGNGGQTLNLTPNQENNTSNNAGSGDDSVNEESNGEGNAEDKDTDSNDREKKYSSLEEYLKKGDPYYNAFKDRGNAKSDKYSVEFSVENNALVYTTRFKKECSDAELKDIQDIAKSTDVEENNREVISSLQDLSGVEGITIRYRYVDAQDNELPTISYDATGIIK